MESFRQNRDGEISAPVSFSKGGGLTMQMIIVGLVCMVVGAVFGFIVSAVIFGEDDVK